jgi:putative hydrolase of the HAD superfamily
VVLKAVVFDFYQTLAETPDWGPSWEELVAELGYTLPPDVRERWWNDGLDGTEHDEHSVSRDHYVAWQQSRVRAMLDDSGVPAAEQDMLIARVREIGAHRSMRAYDDVPELLAVLRDRGLTLAICSNWDWDLLPAATSAGIVDAVDLFVSSAWVGARKPHPRIYAHTLDQLDLGPDEVLFVGDTWTCDVEGPRAMGMRSVYIRRDHLGRDQTAPEVLPDDPHVHHVTSLHSVTTLITNT